MIVGDLGSNWLADNDDGINKPTRELLLDFGLDDLSVLLLRLVLDWSPAWCACFRAGMCGCRFSFAVSKMIFVYIIDDCLIVSFLFFCDIFDV